MNNNQDLQQEELLREPQGQEELPLHYQPSQAQAQTQAKIILTKIWKEEPMRDHQIKLINAITNTSYTNVLNALGDNAMGSPAGNTLLTPAMISLLVDIMFNK